MGRAQAWAVALSCTQVACGAEGGRQDSGAGDWNPPAMPTDDGEESGGNDPTGDDDDDGDDGPLPGSDDGVDDDGADDDGPAQGCPGGPAAWDTVVANAQAYLDAQSLPGAAIAVVCNGQLAHAAGLGVRSTTSGEPITPATRFQLASLTKMFTGAAAVALSEAGTVDLHAPVSTVLPSVGYGDVTLHQLLTHTASYPTQFSAVTSNDLVTVVLDNGNQPMWAPPGAVWNYSNPGFSVAGAVLEQASGTSFADLVQSNVFAPAGMSRATMQVPEVLADADFAYGHPDSPGGSPIAPDGLYYASGSYGPMGGAWGSVEDLARWGEVHLASGGEVLSASGAALLSEFHTRTSSSDQGYGYGLFVDAYHEPVVLSHGGGVGGFVSDWRIVPDLDFGAFAVLNGDWGDPSELSYLIIDQYIDLGFADEPPGNVNLADFEGTYDDPFELGTITVSSDGAQLTATIDGSSAPMNHIGEDTFSVFVPSLGFEIYATFWRAGGTQAEYLVSIWGIASRS